MELPRVDPLARAIIKLSTPKCFFIFSTATPIVSPSLNRQKRPPPAVVFEGNCRGKKNYFIKYFFNEI